MNESLVICGSCHCHLHSDERRCPHCGADLAAEDALLVVHRSRVDIHRVLVAVAAVGLTGAACGGGGTTDHAVLGDCAPPGMTQQLSCSSQCSCGSNGRCNNGTCIACSPPCTNSIEWCHSDGTCRPCYGAPPPLV